MAELAARGGATLQILTHDILARWALQPPAEQSGAGVGRLNEAVIVADDAERAGNLNAVDRAVKIDRQMDRCHGFFEKRGSAAVGRMETAP
jgi:hypothetical protein